MRIHQVVFPGERFPRGYGLAWREYDRDIAIALPVPLNVIAGWCRFLYLRLRFYSVPAADPAWNAKLWNAYEAGFCVGVGVHPNTKAHADDL